MLCEVGNCTENCRNFSDAAVSQHVNLDLHVFLCIWRIKMRLKAKGLISELMREEIGCESEK